MKKITLPPKAQLNEGEIDHDEVTSMMMDPGYLRQSSSLIQDALQKGFDVLQLANGDIVTTGTKTFVYQYRWDAKQNKLAKVEPEKASEEKELEPPVPAEA